MKYADLRQHMQKVPIFSREHLRHLTENQAVLQKQLSLWITSGAIIRLRRGLYSLNKNDRQAHYSRYFLANQLCSPSYISLESALSLYQLIPEQVPTITSVTTKKTAFFENPDGAFQYHHIKTSVYDDFIEQRDEFGLNYLLATPERALIDLFYFRTSGVEKPTEDLFEESFRLQNLETIDEEKLLRIAKTFKQKKLYQITAVFCDFLRKEYD